MEKKTVTVRFLTTICANIIRAGLNFACGVIIARSLAPAGYGDLMFLLGSFSSIRALTDFGSSSAFYTFLSQNNRTWSFYFYYFLWIIAQFLIILVAVCFILPQSLIETVWLGHEKGLIILAFLAVFIQQPVWQTITQIGEAKRLTVKVQMLNIGISSIQIFLISIIALTNYLTIKTILYIYILEYILMTLIGLNIFKTHIFDNNHASPHLPFPNLFQKYFNYCRPLIIITIVGFFYDYLDKWMLQYFGGASQQGFFQIANQFSMISLLFTASLLNIFWKEIGAAYESGDKARVHTLYTKAMRGLTMAAAALSGFLIPWTEDIVHIFLGDFFKNAVPVLMIMLIFPVHQAMGQLVGVFFLSTNNTKLYSILSVLVMSMSIPLSYFVQAPTSGYLLPGLGLGAMGMASKLLIINIISVNISIYYISRLQQWPHDWNHQIYAISLSGFLGYISYWGVSILADSFYFADKTEFVISIIIAALLYFPSIIFICWRIPWLIGLSRLEVQSLVQTLNNKFRST